MASRTVVAGGVFVLFLWGAVAGCGSSGPNPYSDELSGAVPVKGKVTVDGEPAPLVTLTFAPDASKGNEGVTTSTAMTDESGTYEIVSSSSSGSGETAKGLPPGWYKVSVVTELPPGMDMKKEPSVEVAEKYKSLETTDLSVEVKADAAEGAYDLELTGGD